MCGIETEYGVVLRNAPESNPVLASSLLINAYVEHRRIGWDFEDESPGNDARGFSLDDALAPDIETHLVNAVLTNGARYYVPKANLRHPSSYSRIEEFTSGGFKEVIDDATADAGKVKKVLFCSGKIYFDLAERQQKENRTDVAIIRLEQIYPLPYKQLDTLDKKYSKATWFWVQEEPMNMGAASFLRMNLTTINYGVIGRQPSASTATGYNKVHQQEQSEIIETAFSI